MARPISTTSEARQRILSTADRLFYEHGFRAVGIDRVIAEAGVAKMTLYSHFPSKDDLILAVLQERDRKEFEFFRNAIARHSKSTSDALSAFFDGLSEFLHSPTFRGCVFQNIAIELADPNHPASEYVRQHKQRFAEFMTEQITASFGAAGTSQAPAIALLVEGAIVSAVVLGDTDAVTTAREAAFTLLKARKRTGI